MDYLLDTNACIALINGTPSSVRRRLSKALDAGAQIFTSAVTVFELWYGVSKSTRLQTNKERLAVFLSGPIDVLSFEGPDGRAAGSIRAALEVSGKPIGAYETLIAGQAMARTLTLVTADVKEFTRVNGLRWEDWAKE